MKGGSSVICFPRHSIVGHYWNPIPKRNLKQSIIKLTEKLNCSPFRCNSERLRTHLDQRLLTYGCFLCANLTFTEAVW